MKDLSEVEPPISNEALEVAIHFVCATKEQALDDAKYESAAGWRDMERALRYAQVLATRGLVTRDVEQS